ncbi:MAG: tail fiber domain-containing protein [Myxococcota bacterium]|nr:tail fiber domain-containing protein [Myxococcota bacterium]
MIQWMKKLFGGSKTPRAIASKNSEEKNLDDIGSSKSPRATASKNFEEKIPDSLIKGLASEIAKEEWEKLSGYSTADSGDDYDIFKRMVEEQLREILTDKNRAIALLRALYLRNKNTHSSGSSSPISDIRLKENIRPLQNALKTTVAMRGVQFNWQSENNLTYDFSKYPEVGLLAQEVEEVLPSVVCENEEGYKTVNYACLVPVLIEAIKEQQLSINRLQDSVRELEAVLTEI